MNFLYKLSFALILTLSTVQVSFAQKKTKYKCMVQLTNYMGEGAYVAISLLDAKGAYQKTLYIMGPDKKWFNTLKEWDKFHKAKPSNISAITGASVTNGDRSVAVIEIEDDKINKGYKLRFETAVEDKEYFAKDVEIPLTTAGLAAKTEGKGYIRYVRLSANN